jgi:prepilin-type processing-associated H-X9-DG protein/prepilin-type N-terminal cleavage/methylation domain-containing protein
MCVPVRDRDRWPGRPAVTLVELLVVITIIGILMAMLFPALSTARGWARSRACQSNLKQFAVGMMAHADRHGTYCSGAFDWNRDGCVTEVGWVADLVDIGTQCGEMLCPSNPCKLSQTYNDLLNLPDTAFSPCVDHAGSSPVTAPDGSTITNPCREIVDTPLAPGDEPRRLLVEARIYGKSYNTNYTASWFLVRSGVVLDEDGNLMSKEDAGAGCEVSLASRASTFGPLEVSRVDSGTASASAVPLLGDGAPGAILSRPIGPVVSGTPMAKSFTKGPVLDVTMEPPSFAAGTPRTGADGWWGTWNNSTLQDYRGFAPVHQGTCNVLFADGSVRALIEGNGRGDGLLNNGFSAGPTTGFTSDRIEVTEEEIFSRWSLRATVP